MAAPPIAAPTITPVWLERFAAADGEIDIVENDDNDSVVEADENDVVEEDNNDVIVGADDNDVVEDDNIDAVDLVALRDFERVRAALDEEEGVASIEDDGAMSDAEVFASRGTGCPLITKSPLFSLQHLTARAPVPQQ